MRARSCPTVGLTRRQYRHLRARVRCRLRRLAFDSLRCALGLLSAVGPCRLQIVRRDLSVWQGSVLTYETSAGRFGSESFVFRSGLSLKTNRLRAALMMLLSLIPLATWQLFAEAGRWCSPLCMTRPCTGGRCLIIYVKCCACE